MAYVRPSAEEIDSWESAATGWAWADLEPYFRKSETMLPSTDTFNKPVHFTVDSKFHGGAGPIHVSFPPTKPDIETPLIKAMNDTAGLQPRGDAYAESRLGFYQLGATIDRRGTKVRRSYAINYLGVNQSNLKILTNASVQEILLSGDSPSLKATGIRLHHGSQLYEIHAHQEVILAAGAIDTPRLLEISGIGNPDVLSKAGIECKLNLPEVGENLQEHPMTAVVYELEAGSKNTTLDSLHLDQSFFQEQVNLLTEKGEGLMSGPFTLVGWIPYASQVSGQRLNSVIASTKSAVSDNCHRNDKAEWIINRLQSRDSSNIQIVGFPANIDIAAGYANQAKLVPGPPPGRNACYSLLIGSTYVMSGGSVHIQSAKPFSNGDPNFEGPEIDFNLLSNQYEIDVLAAGLTFANRVFKSSHLVGRIKDRVQPAPEVDLENEEHAREYVKSHTMIFNHALGTCALGLVVDEMLRVKGVGGLRIVDASVIPKHFSANPMATVYAVAEKAADMIKLSYPD
jgi:choline dehydrogenase-like flavoprotein